LQKAGLAKWNSFVKILFVCTANICRSFMAERVFRKMTEKSGRSDISGLSASLIDMKGALPDPKAAGLLAEKGFDGHGHKSRLLTEELAAETDMILVMERQQREMIIEKYPNAAEKVFLLKPFSTGDTRQESNGMNDISDPYRKSGYHYRLCFAEIYMGIEGLLKCI
jgi:protein-tyrosine-phosphatase